ncbi:DUF397 domain-containing protein [Streptomyces smaragdinus]|uniref:DUF397 domain-containing protein n=1 Tax=Streptomyces smaragdinus TaxID=2585196 RepID=UPI002B1F30F1|nr:DUF397 domain-containing protein [Streptomyces smaragdinus]
MSDIDRKVNLYGIDLSAAVWRKSPFSDAAEQCVEIADLPGGGIALRDSKNPELPAHRFTAEEWHAFVRGLISGEL